MTISITWLPASLLTQLILLVAAFILSAVVGVERQRRLKSAGLRTHTLVGVGAALFTIVSAYGFDNVLGSEVVLDPSRIAAQIVSGIGFLGAGVIFVRQNVVNGLTTAASIWLTAAIGMACGAGMPFVAAFATLLYVIGVTLLPYLSRKIPRIDKDQVFLVQYKENRGALRLVLARATELGYDASLTHTRKIESAGKQPKVEASMKFKSAKPGPLDDLIDQLTNIKGVISVEVTNSKEEDY